MSPRKILIMAGVSLAAFALVSRIPALRKIIVGSVVQVGGAGATIGPGGVVTLGAL